VSDNIWAQVQRHSWKYRRRTRPISIVLIHATRSSQPYTSAKEYSATVNWFVSPNNIIRKDETYGSMASRIIGNFGGHCIVMPDDVYPAYSAGHIDPMAISFEICQPTNATPFHPSDIDRAVVEVAAVCKQYGIPPRHIRYLSGDNHEGPGIAFHDASANGTTYGKSDPGVLFDRDGFCGRVAAAMQTEPEEDDMAIELIWCPMPDGSGRLYVLGQGDPRWITNPAVATELTTKYGNPQRALSWGAMVALGAR